MCLSTALWAGVARADEGAVTASDAAVATASPITAVDPVDAPAPSDGAAVAPISLDAQPVAAAQPLPVSAGPDTRPGTISSDLANAMSTAPSLPVSVIVQAETASNAATAVWKAEGYVTAKLQLINGVAARVRAGNLAVLVRLPGVKAITSDSGMRHAESGRTEVVGDGSDDAAAPPPAPSTQALDGRGIGVAVVDSGVANTPALAGRLTHVSISGGSGDPYGHGTHVAGILAGTGAHPGVAPGASIIDVKVTDSGGRSSASTLIRGLQWVAQNAAARNIRVVNVSISAQIGQSARVDPIDAAVDALWARGIVVVVSAGNRGANPGATGFAPGNAPRAITVGATTDDGLRADFSSTGITPDGVAKPNIMAHGAGVVSLLASPSMTLALQHPAAVTEDGYFRMSGTSMAAPAVAGAAAVVLQAHPSDTPDQVKAALLGTAVPVPGETAGAVDVNGAVAATDVSAPNPGLPDPPIATPVAGLTDPGASALASELGVPMTDATWTSATWTSATWTSATWTSATWTSESRS
jgi:serine protease AprX